MGKKITVYWAAPCFTQAERSWNRDCAEYLNEKNYQVILPQDEASQFLDEGKSDFNGLAHHCMKQAIESDVMVAILDGSDSDSGMSMECGLRIGAGKSPTIGVRTDFRASEDGHLNAMFRLLDEIIYHPAFSETYEEVCRLIDEAIQRRLTLSDCEKCGGNGVIVTGNNDLPCDCPAGATALFNVCGVVGEVTGEELRRHFLNNSPEPIALGKEDISADSLPGRQK